MFAFQQYDLIFWCYYCNRCYSNSFVDVIKHNFLNYSVRLIDINFILSSNLLTL